VVRTVLEKQDANLAPGISARDEIGRAIADKIRELKSAKELSKVVEEVLPGVTEFLESPEEKRLRRIRIGTIIASIGLGAVLAFGIIGVATKEEDHFFLAGLGLTTLLIGLGFVFNGLLFTIPKKRGLDKKSESLMQTARESLADPVSNAAVVERMFPASINEHTTHQLPDTNTGEK
jgi:hypothetical protein